MKRKVHNSLKEAALQVQLGEATEVDNQTESVEIPDSVLEYFENYFGDELNEDTSDEDIMEAVESLVDLCDAVCDAIGLDEKKLFTLRGTRRVQSPVGKKVPTEIMPPKGKRSKADIHQMQSVRPARTKPVEEPLVIHGQGSYQKKIMPSDVIKPKSQQ